jgi:hypothetical protein
VVQKVCYDYFCAVVLYFSFVIIFVTALQNFSIVVVSGFWFWKSDFVKINENPETNFNRRDLTVILATKHNAWV